jgi:hypothetical protein
MEKRSDRRISANERICFSYDDAIHSGTITDLSTSGMYIKTDMPLYYYKLKFDVRIPLANGFLNVPVKIVRLEQTAGYYYGMGVELLDLPEQYLKLIDTIKYSSHYSKCKHVMLQKDSTSFKL